MRKAEAGIYAEKDRRKTPFRQPICCPSATLFCAINWGRPPARAHYLVDAARGSREPDSRLHLARLTARLAASKMPLSCELKLSTKRAGFSLFSRRVRAP